MNYAWKYSSLVDSIIDEAWRGYSAFTGYSSKPRNLETQESWQFRKFEIPSFLRDSRYLEGEREANEEISDGFLILQAFLDEV